MLLSNQSDIDEVTPMPIDSVDDTSVVLAVSSETITWFHLVGSAWASATGEAAGTIVYGKTVYDGILNSSKSALGNNADSSVSFAAATRVSQRINVPSGVLSRIERMTPANQKAAMEELLTTAGDYIVDHRRGRIWANMKATVANDSISYSVKSTSSVGSSRAALSTALVARTTGNAGTLQATAAAAIFLTAYIQNGATPQYFQVHNDADGSGLSTSTLKAIRYFDSYASGYIEPTNPNGESCPNGIFIASSSTPATSYTAGATDNYMELAYLPA